MKISLAAGLQDIVTAVSAPPLRYFQKIFPLSFPVFSAVERLSIDTQATRLEAAFVPAEYNAVAPGGWPPAVVLGDSGGFLLIALDGLKQVLTVRTSLPSASRTVEFFRLDGSCPASSPTLTTPEGGSLAQEFTDVRFAIRVKDSDGAPISSLSPDQLKELTVRSFPTGPRIGVRLAGAPSPPGPVLFWQAPGEIRPGAPGDLGLVHAAGPALAKQLQALLDEQHDTGLNAPFPQCLAVELVIQSDTPCQVNVGVCDIGYHRMIQAWEGEPRDKRVLRFSGSGVSTQQAAIRLPGQAQVVSATLDAVESFRAERAPTRGEALVLNAEPAQQSGAFIEDQKWVAQCTTLQQPTAVAGLALALLAIRGKTELVVELQADAQGLPGGQALATARIVADRVGKRYWAPVFFPAVSALQPQPVWVVLKVASGAAVWLTEPGGNPVRVLEQLAESRSWAQSGLLHGQTALVRVLSPSAPQPRQWPAPLTLSVGKQVLTPARADKDKKTFVLNAALTAYLQERPEPSVSVPLSFSAATPGMVTVYAPVVRFDA